MPKPLIDLASAGAGTMNRAHKALGPGLFRVNAAEGSKEAEILVYGEIGGWWDGINAETFVPMIRDINADTIHLRVNSPGGSVFDGVAIYNAVAQHGAHVVAHVEGLAASIASIIIMAADEIRIGEAANIMIHKPWSMAIGDADSFRAEAAILDNLEGGLVDIYKARTGRPAEELQPLVQAETWFRGQAAIDAGFADKLIPAKAKETKKNSLQMPLLNLFKNTPQDLIASDGDSPAVRQFERLLRDAEGVSSADAKRLAGLAARTFGPQRDVETPAPCDGEDRELEMAIQAQALAAFLKSLSK